MVNYATVTKELAKFERVYIWSNDPPSYKNIFSIKYLLLVDASICRRISFLAYLLLLVLLY